MIRNISSGGRSSILISLLFKVFMSNDYFSLFLKVFSFVTKRNLRGHFSILEMNTLDFYQQHITSTDIIEFDAEKFFTG